MDHLKGQIHLTGLVPIPCRIFSVSISQGHGSKRLEMTVVFW